MRTRKVMAGLVVVVAIAIVAPLAISQGPDGEKGGEGMQIPPEALANMMPGEHHEYLNVLEGKWNVTSKYWMAPDQPPSESAGTSTFKWLFEGRYLQENLSMVGAMGPFQGRGFIGYDNQKKKYFSVWMDSMSTRVMVSEGTCDDSHKVFTFLEEGHNSWLGEKMKYRSVLKVINDAKVVFEMFQTGEDGQENKALEVNYTRA